MSEPKSQKKSHRDSNPKKEQKSILTKRSQKLAEKARKKLEAELKNQEKDNQTPVRNGKNKGKPTAIDLLSFKQQKQLKYEYTVKLFLLIIIAGEHWKRRKKKEICR